MGKNATKATGQETAIPEHGSGRCPWPFILLHDPSTGMRCWQTWLVLGLFVSWAYSEFLSMTTAADVTV